MLNNDDIDVLLKALDAYKSQASQSGFTSVLLSALFSKKDEQEEFNREATETMERAKAESDALEETVILLKAKLFQMRDKATINERAEIMKAGSSD